MVWLIGMEAEAFVAYLNFIKYDGYSHWELPSNIELETLLTTNLGEIAGSSLANSHDNDYKLFSNVQDGFSYWSVTEDASDHYNALSFDTINGSLRAREKNDKFYVWAMLHGKARKQGNELLVLK